MKDLKIGDVVRGKDIFRFGDRTWFNVYTVVDFSDLQRFGKQDRLYTVTTMTSDGHIIDHGNPTKRWSGQLF